MSIRWNLLRKAGDKFSSPVRNGLYALIFSASAINTAEGEGGAGAHPGPCAHRRDLGPPLRRHQAIQTALPRLLAKNHHPPYKLVVLLAPPPHCQGFLSNFLFKNQSSGKGKKELQ